MSTPKTVKTPKGTELPLLNLKGKSYLMGAYRLQWFNEEVKSFTIKTEFLTITDTHSIAKAEVTIFDDEGKVLKQASATKKEDKAGFADFLEKSESSAIFRCLAMLGYGTQFALSDLDEGHRIVDSPVESVKTTQKLASVPTTETEETSPELANVEEPVKKHKWTPGKKKVAATGETPQNDNW
jgi:hypothetical protein